MSHLGRYRDALWLAPAGVAAGLTLVIMLVLPADRTLHTVWDFALKLSPVVFAVLAIASFPRQRVWAPYAVLIGCAVFLGLLDSASFLQVSRLVDAALAGAVDAQFAAYYRFTTFVDAFVVLFGVAAYRLGGGSGEKVLRLGLAATCLLVSGLNDLTMWAMYPWPNGVRPGTFDWASHVSIFIGRPPRLADMLVFLALHLSLAALVMLVPLPRNRWGQWRRGQRPAVHLIPQATRGPEPVPPEH